MEYIAVIEELDSILLGICKDLNECADLVLKTYPTLIRTLEHLAKEGGFSCARAYLIALLHNKLNNIHDDRTEGFGITAWRVIVNE